MKITKSDIFIAASLMIISMLMVYMLRIYVVTVETPPFVNSEMLYYFSFFLGFVIFISIGNILSKNIHVRVLGAFMFAASLFTLLLWNYLFEGGPLAVGAIISLAIVGVTYYNKNYSIFKHLSVLILVVTALIYLYYLIFLYQTAIFIDMPIIIASLCILIFPVLIFPILKSE